MAVSTSFASSKVLSQSDSNLLGQKPEENGAARGGSFGRSVDDINLNPKKKNFFYKLVRPWKWRRRRRPKGEGENTHCTVSINTSQLAGCIKINTNALSLKVYSPSHVATSETSQCSFCYCQ